VAAYAVHHQRNLGVAGGNALLLAACFWAANVPRRI